MSQPTLDHLDSPGCCCTWRLCARCYAELEREQAEHQLQQWLDTYGTLEEEEPTVRVPLRLVR